jgi:hypothetical protein
MTQEVCYGIQYNNNFVDVYKVAWAATASKTLTYKLPGSKTDKYEKKCIAGYWPDGWDFNYSYNCVSVITPHQTFKFNQMYFRKLILSVNA